MAQASAKNSGDNKQNGDARNAFLAQIRKGVQLKKVASVSNQYQDPTAVKSMAPPLPPKPIKAKPQASNQNNGDKQDAKVADAQQNAVLYAALQNIRSRIEDSMSESQLTNTLNSTIENTQQSIALPIIVKTR